MLIGQDFGPPEKEEAKGTIANVREMNKGKYGIWNSILISGETGSENGIIIADEEYKNACRITLEKSERYYAITCGVYGALLAMDNIVDWLGMLN